MLKQPLKLFIAYARDDREYLRALIRHLAPLCRERLVQIWHDGDIEPGEEWGQLISNELGSAQIIVVLVSASFISSYECYDVELAKALKRHDANDVILIPTIVRHCVWKNLPFSRIHVLPTDAMPVRAWLDEDEAWTDVVNGISRVVRRLCNDVAAEKANAHGGHVAPTERSPSPSRVDLTGSENATHSQIHFAANGKENVVPRVANDIVAVREASTPKSDGLLKDTRRLDSSKHSGSTDTDQGNCSTFPDEIGARNNEASPPREPDSRRDISIRAASPTVYETPSSSAIAEEATRAYQRSTSAAPPTAEEEFTRKRRFKALSAAPDSEERSNSGAFAISALKRFLITLLGSAASGVGACVLNFVGETLRLLFHITIFTSHSTPQGGALVDNMAFVGVPIITIWHCYMFARDKYFAPKGIGEWMLTLIGSLVVSVLYSGMGAMVVCFLGLAPVLAFEYFSPGHQFLRSSSANLLAMLCGATIGLYGFGLWSLTTPFKVADS